MRNLLKIVSITLIACVSISSANAEYSTPDLSLVPEGCMAVIKTEGWGIVCPNSVGESFSRDARNTPSLILPGYSSNGYGFAKPNKDYIDYPMLCNPARLRFTSHASKFVAGIRRDLLTSGWNVLTRQAVYGLVNIIVPYTRQTDEDAMAKYRMSKRGNSSGDIACKAHYDFAYTEIDRIAHLIVAELNEGNRDLANTGLNMRTSPYNK